MHMYEIGLQRCNANYTSRTSVEFAPRASEVCSDQTAVHCGQARSALHQSRSDPARKTRPGFDIRRRSPLVSFKAMAPKALNLRELPGNSPVKNSKNCTQ
jgi:hypothetical protein